MLLRRDKTRHLAINVLLFRLSQVKKEYKKKMNTGGGGGWGWGDQWMNKANSKGMTLYQTRINLSSNVQYRVHTIFLTGDGVSWKKIEMKWIKYNEMRKEENGKWNQCFDYWTCFKEKENEEKLKRDWRERERETHTRARTHIQYANFLVSKKIQFFVLFLCFLLYGKYSKLNIEDGKKNHNWYKWNENNICEFDNTWRVGWRGRGRRGRGS